MASNLPIVERIADHIVDTLKTVRLVNNYQHDLNVRRAKKRGNAPTSGECLAVVALGQTAEVPNSSQDKSVWDQTFLVDCYIANQAEDLEEPLDRSISKLRADVEKALAFEEQSRTRGGMAQDTKVKAPFLFQRPGGLFGVQVRIVVTYPTEFNNPYKSAYSNIE